METWAVTLPPLRQGILGDPKLRTEALALSAALAARVDDGIRTFGLEQKAVAFCATSNVSHDDLDQAIGRGAHVAADPRRLVGRVSFEPIAFSYWGLFTADALTPDHVRNLGEALSGPKAVARTGAVKTGSAETGFQHYPPPPGATWPEEALGLIRSSDDPLSSAIVALGAMHITHPLQDGNGRLARALFWSRLALIDGIRGPFFPFGFTAIQNPAWVAASSIDLGVHGDWNAFADRYLRVMISSSRLALTMSEQGLL